MNPLYPILFNLSIFIALTSIHFFWLLGGSVGMKYAFPYNSKSKKRFYHPGKFGLFIKTIILAAMAWFCLAQTGSFNFMLNDETIRWGNRVTGIIFILRAIGNFRYVGFTKTFKEGEFAQLDTYVYSPLCLIIVLCAWISSGSF